MTRQRFNLLRRLLEQPTAPFREMHVMALAKTELERRRVPFFFDPAGNLIVGCRSASEYRRLARKPSDEPLRVFIAHMDHPGFHVVRRISSTRLSVKWHGGSPTRHLAGSRVWLADADGYIGQGKLGAVKLHKHGRSIDRAEVRLPRSVSREYDADSLFGGFAFRAPIWRQGGRLYTKAADDLVGVFAILATALDLYGGNRRATHPFIGLLTRGEEVGFIGALAHFELDWLANARRPIVCVSLETSRTLPGAIVGKGPVVRLGDRRTVFDAGGMRVLSELAEEVLPGRHQRRIMDGGTCEATAAIAHGLPAIGISVPLGNYHNEGFEGGPDDVQGRTSAAGDRKSGAASRGPRGPAPEFVHLDDIDGMVKLCAALMRPGLPWDNPWRAVRRQMKKNLRAYRSLLKQTS
jgi:endoglucanase